MKGADADMEAVKNFEGAPQRQPIVGHQGLRDFAKTESRNQRRELLDGFWFD